MGEFPLIQRLTKGLPGGPPVIKGVGDDCAVLESRPGRYQLFTTDMVIQGIHFEKDKIPLRRIGHKALARNISDIAAMGGYPTYALVALSVPRNEPLRSVQEIYTGLKACAKKADVLIVGGDTGCDRSIHVTVSLLGEVEKQNLVLRSGARPGDSLFVTGALGGSIRRKHYMFEPRLPESRFLARHFPVRAMIDVSDGLAQDLAHILKASSAGCVLNSENVPLSRDARALSQGSRDRALDRALYDGEDFELLFTLAPRHEARLERRWKELFRTRLTKIGTVTQKKSIIMKDQDGREKRCGLKGFRHF